MHGWWRLRVDCDRRVEWRGGLLNSPNCSALFDCITNCPTGDDVCEGGCYNMYSKETGDMYIAVDVCLDCACSNDCGMCSG
jgi:hypothetical protein